MCGEEKLICSIIYHCVLYLIALRRLCFILNLDFFFYIFVFGSTFSFQIMGIHLFIGMLTSLLLGMKKYIAQHTTIIFSVLLDIYLPVLTPTLEYSPHYTPGPLNKLLQKLLKPAICASTVIPGSEATNLSRGIRVFCFFSIDTRSTHCILNPVNWYDNCNSVNPPD